MDTRIAVGIVIYNPKQDRLNECVNSILQQTDRIYIYDNTKSQDKRIANYDFIKNLSNSVEYMTENENKGIACALNCIMERAKDNKYEWVVTMDQDSIMPEGIINDYKEHIKNNQELGIVCPQVIDKRRSYMEIKKEPEKEYVEECITSASCTSIAAWEKIGKFDEWLFIDLVDNEFCKRLVQSGYKILRLNKWTLDQEFGKIIPKSPRKQKFWIKISKILHNNNFAKFSYSKFVSPMRVYYTNRNIIYVNRKLKKYGKTGYKNYNCRGYVGFLISFSLPSFLRAQEKGQVFKAIINGIRDGRRENPKEWSIGS